MKNIIVVEGKTDSNKLKKVLGDQIITFETHGLSLHKNDLNDLKSLSQNSKVIIFTDPDYAGLKIREKVSEYLDNNCYHAFIDKSAILTKKKGIAEASDEQIKQALENLILLNNDEQSLSYADYLNEGFYLKPQRVKIANHFNWSTKINSKRLYKWINLMGLKKEDLKDIIDNNES